MNITNKDYFTFNVDNSLLLVGQTGSGKTELIKTLLKQLESAFTPDQMKYALFDMKMVEFTTPGRDYNPAHLYFDVVTDPKQGLEGLDLLAVQAEKRANEGGDYPLLFIYIEECDIAAIDQKRFDAAVITINTNAKKANMKLVYSTSRPSPDVVSKELIASFDLIMTGQLASEADAKHLGVSYRAKSEPYSFLVTQHTDIYNAEGEHHEMFDISNINLTFGGENEPHDDHLSELLKSAYKGEVNCRKAVIPMDLIKPFSSFEPKINEEYSNHFMEAYQNNLPPDLLVYEKDGNFIMSDDYNAYFMYRFIKAKSAVCTVIGESTITDGIEYGPEFKMQLPTLEAIE